MGCGGRIGPAPGPRSAWAPPRPFSKPDRRAFGWAQGRAALESPPRPLLTPSRARAARPIARRGPRFFLGGATQPGRRFALGANPARRRFGAQSPQASGSCVCAGQTGGSLETTRAGGSGLFFCAPIRCFDNVFLKGMLASLDEGRRPPPIRWWRAVGSPALALRGAPASGHGRIGCAFAWTFYSLGFGRAKARPVWPWALGSVNRRIGAARPLRRRMRPAMMRPS